MNIKSLLVAVLALAAPGSAFAGSNSTTFTVQADVIKECAVDGGNLVFPNSGLLTTNIDATANIQIECTGAMPYTLNLSNAGDYNAIYASGSPTGKSFSMLNGGNRIGYLIYSDASRTTVLDGVTPISGTSTGGVQQIPVYGRIYAQDSKPAGVYNQALGLTLTF